MATARRVLVIHGPNLNLLGERPGDERGRTLSELDHLLQQRAGTLGLELRIFQSNHEGALVDRIHAERNWAQGILINPEALTHTSYVLREALAAVGKPAIEVHLMDIRRRESWRRKSVIKDVCAAQVMGKGFDSYLIALERFATGDLSGRRRASAARTVRPAVSVGRAAAEDAAPRGAVTTARVAGRSTAPEETGGGKTLGREAGTRSLGRGAEGGAKTIGRWTASTEVAAMASGTKSIGRGGPASSGPATSPSGLARSLGRAAEGGTAVEFLSRALVRQKIADRLSGKLTPAALAGWARSHYEQVRRGGAAETGHREVLEDTLQALTLSVVPPAKLTDEELVDLMAQLEG